jgi:hypothetical protein
MIRDGVERRDRSGGIRLNGTTIEYVEKRSYLVDGGSKTVTRAEVLTTVGLPIVGISVLDNNSGAVCSSIDCQSVPQNPRYFEVIAEFSTQASDQKSSPDPGGTVSPNPTSWIPVYRTSYEKHPVESVFDATGKLIVNSAGTQFAGSLTRFRTITTFTFSQYEPDTLTEQDLHDRNETVNNAIFRTFPKYTLLLSVLGSDRGYFNGYPARKVEYQLKYYKGPAASTFKEWNSGTSTWVAGVGVAGWRRLVKDVGPEYLVGGVKTKATLNGRSIEVNLDGSGGIVASSGEAAVLAFNEYRLINFSTFLRV